MALDPTIRGLNDCGCCEGVTAETPAPVRNRPGLPSLSYRTGQHAAFLRSMLGRLSATSNAGLSRLQTRETDDLTIGLLDAFATMADVLTFYNERIAVESYLRTATERLSILHLARLIGYELAPGVAASTSVAFNLETAAGAPEEVTLEPGVRMQSVPGPGETAQIFETVETIAARGAWNAIKPRLTAPAAPDPAASTLYLAGTDANLKAGDRLLIAGSASSWAVRRIASVTPENEQARTKVTLEDATGGNGPAPAGLGAGVWALRVKATPFGSNAPLKPDPENPGDLGAATEWELAETTSVLALDSVQDAIATGSWVVVDRYWYYLGYPMGLPYPSNGRINLLLKADEVQTLARASYGMTGRVTSLVLSGNWLDPLEWSLWWVRNTAVYAGSQLLSLAEAPLPNSLETNNVKVAGDLSDLPLGRNLVFSGRLLGQAPDAALTTELATLKSVSHSAGYSTLTLDKSLTHSFDRRTVSINGNVAQATQGETVSEVLGGGDPATPHQAFTLKQAPLTYTTGSAGIQSTLSVRVDDVLWRLAPTLFDAAPRDRIYIARTEPDGRTVIRFGDGKEGARLPRGVDNIRATYRKGAGIAGNVKAGQLSMLLTRPLGVKDVINLLPATGGADPQSQEQARTNAPVTVLTLGRVVSLQDYEDFSRGFPGIAKALATWTWDGRRRGVIVTVAGPGSAAIAAGSPTHGSLLGALADSGDPHVPVKLVGFRPVQFRLVATVARSPDYLKEKVEAGVRGALLTAFSFDARGLGQAVALSEVVAVIQAVPGVLGVDVDALHRPNQPAVPNARLRADAPQPGWAAALGAELLTIDAAALSITVD